MIITREEIGSPLLVQYLSDQELVEQAVRIESVNEDFVVARCLKDNSVISIRQDDIMEVGEYNEPAPVSENIVALTKQAMECKDVGGLAAEWKNGSVYQTALLSAAKNNVKPPYYADACRYAGKDDCLALGCVLFSVCTENKTRTKALELLGQLLEKDKNLPSILHSFHELQMNNRQLSEYRVLCAKVDLEARTPEYVWKDLRYLPEFHPNEEIRRNAAALLAQAAELFMADQQNEDALRCVLLSMQLRGLPVSQDMKLFYEALRQLNRFHEADEVMHAFRLADPDHKALKRVLQQCESIVSSLVCKQSDNPVAEHYMVLLQAGRYEAACAYIDDMYAQYPDNELYRDLAVRSSRLRERIRRFRGNEDDPSFYERGRRALYIEENRDAAIQNFLLAVKNQDPRCMQALLAAAKLIRQRDGTEAARTLLEDNTHVLKDASLTLKKSYWQLLVCFAIQLRDYEKACDGLRELIELSKNDGKEAGALYYRLAWLENQLEKYADSMQDCRKAIALRERLYKEHILLLAADLKGLHRKDEAAELLRSYEHALRGGIESLEALKYEISGQTAPLSESRLNDSKQHFKDLLMGHKYAEAQMYSSLMLEKFRDNKDIAHMKAMSDAIMESPAFARSLNPLMGRFFYRLAEAYYAKNDLIEAEKYYQLAMEYEPESYFEALRGLGDVKEQVEGFDSACKTFLACVTQIDAQKLSKSQQEQFYDLYADVYAAVGRDADAMDAMRHLRDLVDDRVSVYQDTLLRMSRLAYSNQEYEECLNDALLCLQASYGILEDAVLYVEDCLSALGHKKAAGEVEFAYAKVKLAGNAEQFRQRLLALTEEI